MLIYLCLSSHGYGHAARQAAIFSELYKLRPDWTYVVSSNVDISFLDLAFKGIPIIHRRVQWDIGTVQTNALNVDIEATLISIDKLNKSYNNIIIQEQNWIEKFSLPILVLADIPPLASKLAEILSAPLIWIGNFGWDDIYKAYDNRFIEHIEFYKSCYSTGSLLISLPFSFGMNWPIPKKEVGLIVNNNRKIDSSFRTFLLNINKPIILINFGGMGYFLPSNHFSSWNEFHFLIMEANITRSTEYYGIKNLSLIPSIYRPIDIMPYCSSIICKPGFSTFCEALYYKLNIYYVTRDSFIESDYLVNSLKKLSSCTSLSKQDFLSGNWKLNSESILNNSLPLSSTGALESSKIISDFI
ncbi:MULTISPECIES: hypothetical protein [unclassified Prochlorococcus]|uniref:hypothetical protein n=1 Tax=unclassified Prochlorococcus TaxID=2627481 RepID=UPI000533B488|nr:MULTISPECIES: hypothetical protein [unclassified Prochlorococcus]KGG15336.1 hypothetical protein EV06_1207 [Prochlorococcus sp. MIT 0602]KGG17614.1 hypothetical protein EV07_1054 [Prochlorococcus sp. MIT 0603]